MPPVAQVGAFDGPAFFTVRVRSVLRGTDVVVQRRYSQFDSLNGKLKWHRAAREAWRNLPAKHPKPSHDAPALALRAAALASWSNLVLSADDISNAPAAAAVATFFGLEPQHFDAEEDRHVAAARLQAAHRGAASRRAPRSALSASVALGKSLLNAPTHAARRSKRGLAPTVGGLAVAMLAMLALLGGLALAKRGFGAGIGFGAGVAPAPGRTGPARGGAPSMAAPRSKVVRR